MTDDAVAYRVRHIMDQYPIQLRRLLLTGVYRARANKPGEIFSNARELWYPPAHVTKPSRLNDAGQVRFYAASAPNTAMLELRPSEGGVVTVLIALTRSDVSELHGIVFLGLERSRAPEVQHLNVNDLFRTSPNFRRSVGDANYKKWLLIDDYLSAILGAPVGIGDSHMYKPTIALGDLLFSYSGLDAINYPSVETDGHGINICLLPEKADALLYPYEAWMVRVGVSGLHPTSGVFAS